jgi:hypothetical protein
MTTNMLAIAVLIAVWLAGWGDAAAFGLAVLATLDLMVILRERLTRHGEDRD